MQPAYGRSTGSPVRIRHVGDKPGTLFLLQHEVLRISPLVGTAKWAGIAFVVSNTCLYIRGTTLDSLIGDADSAALRPVTITALRCVHPGEPLQRGLGRHAVAEKCVGPGIVVL